MLYLNVVYLNFPLSILLSGFISGISFWINLFQETQSSNAYYNWICLFYS